MSFRLLILVALLVLVATLLFMQLPIPPTYAGRIIENAGHMPVFFLVTLGLLIVLRTDFRVEGVRLYAVAGLIGVGLGFLSEVIQRPLSRDASWEDVFSDAIGAACALAVHSLFDRRTAIPRTVRWGAFAIAVASLTFYVAPLVRMTEAYLHRDRQFPLLADFRDDIESAWIVGYGVNRMIENGALDVEFVHGPFPGVALHEPVPDWRGFRALVIDLENPDDASLGFTVRIHDRGHAQAYNDRFNRHYDLAAGERRVLRIDLADVEHAPRGRLMDMSHISDIRLFKDGETGGRRLRIHTLRLE